MSAEEKHVSCAHERETDMHDGPRRSYARNYLASREYTPELCDERHDRLDFELRHFEEKVEKLELCTVKLTEMIERHDKLIDEHSNQISGLEKTPARRMQKLIWYIVSAIVGAVAVALTDHIAL